LVCSTTPVALMTRLSCGSIARRARSAARVAISEALEGLAPRFLARARSIATSWRAASSSSMRGTVSSARSSAVSRISVSIEGSARSGSGGVTESILAVHRGGRGAHDHPPR
jgi:hypothetical protein